MSDDDAWILQAIVDLGRIWLAVTKGVPEILVVLKPLVPADEPGADEGGRSPETA